MIAASGVLLPVPPASVFLEPGAVHCAAEPTLISTILGSCVAVCLHDARLRFGGMNHFVLPRASMDEPSPRFADVAIERLVNGMLGLGSLRADLRAKVFGGAAVLPLGRAGDTVGTHNVRAALERLRAHGIPVVAQRTGGSRGLMIRLYTDSGDVLVRASAAGPGA